MSEGSSRSAASRMTGPGWVRIDSEGMVADIGEGNPPGAADHHAAVLTPGLVDIHCHGGGGATFSTTDPDEAMAAVRLHRRHGTTSMLASLVTAPLDTLLRQIRCLVPLVERGELAGIHLEGPWLNPVQRGAHDPKLLQDPSMEDVDAVLAAGESHVRMVTIAPELPGASAAIRRFRRAGVTVAIGHTDGGAEDVDAAVSAGASVVTHLFNGMRPLHHRDPGVVGAALSSPVLTCELIADGVHVHPDVLALAEQAGAGRIALVTDAMAAAGCADGRFRLGELEVDVVGGVARLRGGGSIAGSTLTLDRAVLTARSAGFEEKAAWDAATWVPADAVGIDAGRLYVGSKGDVVLWGETGRPVAVVRGGVLV